MKNCANKKFKINTPEIDEAFQAALNFAKYMS